MNVNARAPWLRHSLALMGADSVIRRRNWSSRLDSAAELLAYGSVGFIVVATLYAQQFGVPPWWSVQTLVALAAPGACAAMLFNFTGFPTDSPAGPLIPTLPISTRSRFGYFVLSLIRRDLRAALWAIVPPVLYVPIFVPSTARTEALSLVFVVLAFTFAKIIGHRLSIATAAKWRTRWAVVAILTAGAAAPLVAGALTGNWTGFAWLAGPGYLLTVLALLPMHWGLAGLVFSCLASVVASAYLLFAKVDLEDLDHDEEPGPTDEVPADAVPPGAKGDVTPVAAGSTPPAAVGSWRQWRRARVMRQFEEIKTALKLVEDEPALPPFAIPKGIEPALGFFKPDLVETWGAVLGALAILLAVLAALVALVVFDLSGFVGPALWAVPLLYFVGVGYVARSRAPNRMFQVLLRAARKVTKERSDLLRSRAKPSASELSGWAIFETLPVERAVLERLFVQPQGMAALAMGVLGLAIVVLLPVQPFVLWQAALWVPGLAALFTAFFGVYFWFLAVDGESTKVVRFLGIAGIAVWASASIAVGTLAVFAGRLPTLPSLWGPYEWVLLFGTLGLTALQTAYGYQSIREKLVASLLPEKNEWRVKLVAVGAGAAVACLAVVVVIASV